MLFLALVRGTFVIAKTTFDTDAVGLAGNSLTSPNANDIHRFDRPLLSQGLLEHKSYNPVDRSLARDPGSDLIFCDDALGYL